MSDKTLKELKLEMDAAEDAYYSAINASNATYAANAAAYDAYYKKLKESKK